jgi:hypothetical protein
MFEHLCATSSHAQQTVIRAVEPGRGLSGNEICAALVGGEHKEFRFVRIG